MYSFQNPYLDIVMPARLLPTETVTAASRIFFIPIHNAMQKPQCQGFSSCGRLSVSSQPITPPKLGYFSTSKLSTEAVHSRGTYPLAACFGFVSMPATTLSGCHPFRIISSYAPVLWMPPHPQ